jgi:hypothetical protein
MHLIQHIKQKPIARETMILLAAITLGIAVETNALAAGHGGGGGAVMEAPAGFGLLSVCFGDSQTSTATRA